MDRYWLLSNTCYGTWLPGDRRGFVGRVWEHRLDDPSDQPRVAHDLPGAPYDEDAPGLVIASRLLLKRPPVHLTVAHAKVFLAQVRETAGYRRWELRAVAVVFNHFHIVVGVLGDPKPSKVLGDFKSWATRALARDFGRPASETWWTESGWKRRLPDERALAAAIHYVLYDQANPLLTWSPETGVHYGPPPRQM